MTRPVKLAFHDTDTDILAAILARIVARMSAACRSACHRNNFNRACRTCRRGSSRGSRCRCRCRRRGMRALLTFSREKLKGSRERNWRASSNDMCPLLSRSYWQNAAIRSFLLYKVSKWTEYSSSHHASPLRELTHAIENHTVLPATRQMWHSRLHPRQLRPVLDLATLEGCKAEFTQLTWLPTEVVYSSEDGYPSQY